VSSPEVPPGKLYKITDIKEWTRISPEGQFYKVMQIFYITKSGIRGSVEVKKVEFTKEKAAELVEAEAREIEATLEL